MIGFLLALVVAAVPSAGSQEPPAKPEIESVYAFTMEDIDGRPRKLADFEGQVILIVNVASRCGLTPQYAALQSLYERYRDRGFVVLGFPANDFRNQEPGTNEEIKQFCHENYNVTFPMFAKISVNGPDRPLLYRWLIEKAGGPENIQWNFEKFLLDRRGRVVSRFAPAVRPDDPRVVEQIERLLEAK